MSNDAMTRPLTPPRHGAPEPDLTVYGLIHRAFRKDYARMITAAEAIAAGRGDAGSRRILAFADRIGRVNSALRVHHNEEDQVLWPVLERAVGAAAADLARLSGDHHELDPLLDAADLITSRLADAGTHLRADEVREHAAELAAVLRELHTHVDEHIGDEEEVVFPAIRTHVSAVDFDWCEAQFRKANKPSTMVFLVPWLAQYATPQETRDVLRGQLPFRILLSLTRGRFTAKTRLIFGDQAQ